MHKFNEQTIVSKGAMTLGRESKKKKIQSYGCSLYDELRNKWQVNVRAKFVKAHHRGAIKRVVTVGPTT
jgi:hypothetical protein